MFQDVMDGLQFFPLVFNLDIRGFDIHGTLVARINRIYIEVYLYAIRMNVATGFHSRQQPWTWNPEHSVNTARRANPFTKFSHYTPC
jgi:hypothetical protein